ncbi:MAG: L,D-transpeptidase [Clostridia bacterium]|nr:L,D-transpeptidase [Clostridia bacterium]
MFGYEIPYYYMNPYLFRATYRIAINTAARTLTLYKDGKWFKSYPVGVGKPSTPTPKGTFTIKNKAPHPGGVYEPRWMGLTAPHIGIHGPVNPASIGKAMSDGCIRMHSKDIIELYSLVPVGTVVQIT